jgi:riboflavin kinase / FMN adenylyltransferase
VEIIRELEGIRDRWTYPVLAVGNFDGVHLGHQAILRKVVQRAKEVKGTALALTFDPHPVKVLAPDRHFSMLTSFSEKARLLEGLGLDSLICLSFTREFSEQKPREFIENILHQAVRAREVYVGKNFAFGHGREGSAEDLRIIGQSLGIQVSIIEPVLLDDTMVSSSTLRSLLNDGRVAEAALLLGRIYELEGVVVGGERRGRLLGFPTANLQPPPELIPKPGVYAAQVTETGSRNVVRPIRAIAYIGSRPTFGPGDQAIEVHLFKYEGDLYRQRLRVAFIERVRDEMTFTGPEELAQQIKRDVERAQRIHEENEKSQGSEARHPV